MGAVSDNFDQRIEQKIFHSEIVVDNAKLSAELKDYHPVPQIRSFDGEDRMKTEINKNYKKVKTDILSIITDELERIKNDPDLQHLLQ